MVIHPKRLCPRSLLLAETSTFGEMRIAALTEKVAKNNKRVRIAMRKSKVKKGLGEKVRKAKKVKKVKLAC